MRHILVVDDMAVFREPIAASLRLAGYETSCAEDGEQALRMARSGHPDLILLDVSMPKMDGLTALKRLRAEPATAKTHVILLTALSEKKYVLDAAALGISGYLLKSRFRLVDLLERIKSLTVGEKSPAETPKTAPAAAASVQSGAVTKAKQVIDEPIPCLLTSEQFLERIEGLLHAKALSGVVTQVISLANSPRGDMSQLAELIARDPMLSARVIQAANSAKYATAGAVVTSIPDAIRKVGCTTVRNIAAALGVFDSMPEPGADGFNPIACWQHSFAVAQLCERIAAYQHFEQSGLAYVVGLCHDLGEIFIRSEFGKENQQVMDMAARTGRPLDQLYLKMLGLTHAQMIRAVLKAMSLPEAIREPIQLLHSSNAAQATHPLARILWLAEHYANGAMLASGPSSEVSPFTQAFCRTATGEAHPICPDPLGLRAEVLSLTVTLARLSRADEAKLLIPMFKKSPARILLVRGAEMSDFDPVATALESLAEVEIRRQVPPELEAGLFDGVVITTSSPPSDIAARTMQFLRAGQPLPMLTVTCEPGKSDHAGGGTDARGTVSLTELARFVESATQAVSRKVAA